MTKSLSTWHQNRRKRICQVNIKVNLIVWLVEFSGCMTLAIDFLLVGSRNNIVTGILGNLSIICFFILLPCTFLINCSSGVNKITDNSWFIAVTKNFNPSSNENEEVPVSRPENNSSNTLNKPLPSVKSEPNAGSEDNRSENKVSNQIEDDEVPVSKPEKNSSNKLNKHAPSIKSEPNAGTEDNGSENKLENQIENKRKQSPQGVVLKREAWT